MINVDGLNKNQKDAVLADDKYLRIIAGAGSGKTRVLTTRIAHLIEDEGVQANHILAITFTNKAANEMKERIRKQLKDNNTACWISTIHSLCVRILREDILCMDYPRNFTVLDADDQKSILKEAYKELGIDRQTYSYASLLDFISNCKGADISVERAYVLAGPLSGEKIKAQVYEFYCARQKALYALDFDDLILWTVRMFNKYSEVCAKWQKRFNFIHVDEFQDIDTVQYTLITQLTGMHNSLYVVGDPDQTIYTWRGADVNIIMNFDKDFKPCKTIVLNENYRSTDNILNGANSVIKNNKQRVDKELFTQRTNDEKITHFKTYSEENEAAFIARKISQMHKEGKAFTDFAILYRSNYLSRSIEKGLLDEHIPYIIYGGTKFYERAEVKDALCYLRMVSQADDLAFLRIVNQPKRGLGNKAIETIQSRARELDTTLYEACKAGPFLPAKNQTTIDSFVKMIEKWRLMATQMEVFKLLETIIDESGYRKMLEDNHENERIENLKELINDVQQFSKDYPESTLDEYLQLVSLYGDHEETLGEDFVRLMTVHAAKGLEFDTVFVCGMSDGIFPNERAMSEGRRGVEEERRLAYVAFTRAKNKLYLTESTGFSMVLQRPRTQSRFIEEIGEDYIEHDMDRNVGADTIYMNRETNRNQGSKLEVQEPSLSQRVQTSNGVRWRKGDQVEHSKFGDGVVINSSGGFVEIAFKYPFGVKKIASGHPSIKKKEKQTLN